MITNKSKLEIMPNFQEGETILIDKELGSTSFDVVYKIRKITKVKKVGHAGTLDPLATGLLIICTGKMTKQISQYSNLDKTYTGIITLGKTTPSFDLETEFDSEKPLDDIKVDNIYQARKEFLGAVKQQPPIYSAIKHKGKTLYSLARKGIDVERQPREVFISEFEILNIDLPDIYFKITCSKGTYIRALANDFGKVLGCGAYLKKLRRIKIGDFLVSDALSVDGFKKMINQFLELNYENILRYS
ncbi:tRNA pseudouridine(55) synthase TruB [Melioribacteraceae bacterium 4301-Me]|uniref:tRNA pseudouridine(55) synthase TruB n=1 Tax=Pyranulibacter aquaticus TaxID=3163344 RepID=UPI003594B65C